MIAGAAGILATAASAQPSLQGAAPPEPMTNPATTADTSSDHDPNKVICRNVRPPTGTRLGSSRNRQRICQTREQWEQQEREAQEALKVRDRGTCSPGQCSG